MVSLVSSLSRGCRSAIRSSLTLGALLVACSLGGRADAGTLTLTWDPNPEADVTGYLVSWGVASGVYTQTVDVGNQTAFLFIEPDSTVPYYFSVRAYDSAGLVSLFALEIKSVPLTAIALPPASTTSTPSGVSATGATLNGTVNPQGTPATGYFQYGASATYGESTPLMNLGWGMVPVAIDNALLTGLTCSTMYHFRAVATNTGGTVTSADQTFTTAPCETARRTASGLASVDFDGDGVADLTIFRPSTGTWWVRNQFTVAFGQSGDLPVPGDYDGDGVTDLSVYRPSTGTWWRPNQSPIQWGAGGDIPVPADYNGDGITDIMIYRPSDGTWWPLNQAPIQWGTGGDIAISGPPLWGNTLPH